MKQVNYALTMLATSLMLTACGGSGGGNNDMVSSDHGTPPANADVNKKITFPMYQNDANTPHESIKSGYVDINQHRFNLAKKDSTLDFAVLPRGLSNGVLTVVGVKEDGTTEKNVLPMRSYNQFFSATIGFGEGKAYTNGKPIVNDKYSDGFEIEMVAGQPTPVANIPAQGTATYQGLAFNENAQGDFKYTINFADKTGSGSITGLNGQNIELLKGGLADDRKVEQYQSELNLNAAQQTFFSGKASIGQHGSYMIGLYGPHAEEVAGVVSQNGVDSIGVGGTRGEIK